VYPYRRSREGIFELGIIKLPYLQTVHSQKLLLSHYEKGKTQAIRVLENHVFNNIKNMQEKSAFNVMKLSTAPEVMTKRGSRSTYSILHIIIVCIINNSYRTYIKQWCMLTKGSRNKAHMTSLKEPSSQRLLQ
jgi:hypothetical protein